MHLISIQRRLDRYRVLYTRKYLMGCVPNMGIEVANDENHRNGLKLVIGDKKNMSRLRLNLFIVRGPKIFNSLPTVIKGRGLVIWKHTRNY